MRIFVTGGSGFVGRNIIPALIKEGYAVFALARSASSKEKVESLGATAVEGDLTALGNTIMETLRACDYVLHSAAYMDFTYDPQPYYKLNVEATKNLLGLAQEAGIKRFIYISAAPVIPGSPIHNLTEKQAQPHLPRDLYPKTKALAERAVLNANSKNFQTISLRPPAIWGPNNHHYQDLLATVKEGKWRWIGGGNHVLSTIHVLNLANAILAAIKSSKGGEAYFVTDGDRRSVRETFTAILQAEGLDPGNKVLPRGLAIIVAHIVGGAWKILGLKSRPPVAPLMIRLMGTEFSVSDQKARQELQYRNAISFKEGIAAMTTN
ncbi:MAG: NAD-dependent epimerase/dehydratase family protein [Saprospiraceae bacterium]|nr:NAD-dependent epimerase/dehydratase family protein [Saprospiraceae bacterium]